MSNSQNIEFYEWNTGEWLRITDFNHSLWLFAKNEIGQWQPLRKLTTEDRTQLEPLFTKIYLDKIT